MNSTSEAAAQGVASAVRALVAASIKAATNALVATLKGAQPGHPFYGNQYTGGLGGAQPTMADQEPEHLEAMRQYRFGTVASETAQKAGIDPAILKYGGDGYNFEVGGQQFKAAGQYDPSTGEITLFDGALTDSKTTAEVTTHEAEHRIYSVVQAGMSLERQSLVTDKGDPIWADGALKPGYEEKYPIHALLEPYERHGGSTSEEFHDAPKGQLDNLIKKDGVSPYSTAYWDAVKSGTGSVYTAINETLAEVARITLNCPRSSDGKVSKVWKGYYNATQAAYQLIGVK